MTKHNRIFESYLTHPGFLVLDGGLATELEARGHDLNHPLWSARLLTENPDAIRDVHRSYLEAGADCLITASYQASFSGFAAQGLTQSEAECLMLRSVELALEGRKQFLAEDHSGGQRPLVAASIGPYGAALADGSEYRGDYGLSRDQLREFHEERWRLLAGSEADLLACETIPSAIEAEALLELIATTPEIPVWVSFSCRDGQAIRDGTPIEDVIRLFADCVGVVALGINCTAPRWIPPLVEKIRASCPNKPIVVYPNSGELYDAEEKIWLENETSKETKNWTHAVRNWYEAGARLIGGCCRTGPEHVRAIRSALGSD